MRGVDAFLCPRGWLINQILILCRDISTTAWAQKSCPPYETQQAEVAINRSGTKT
jgi:hypothetical protein